MKTNDAVTALAALAQESRLAIYRLLVQAGPEGMAAGAVAAKLGVLPATLSFHLKELSRADLVSSRQDGRYVIYAANFGNMEKLVMFLTENCCGGNACTSKPACSAAGEVKQGETA